jgi:hypothetical protein
MVGARIVVSRIGPYIFGAIVALLLVLGVYFYGEAKKAQGARETQIEFREQDLKGAARVREKTREILDRVGSDFDVDELLRSTGGLRD